MVGVFSMIHLLATVIIGLSALTATPKPLSWQVDYGKALAAARTGQRPLLVVLDAPKNDASKDGQKSVNKKLMVDQTRSELLKAYQRCHVDVTTEYGKKVAKVFGATQFPLKIIIDKTGSTILCKKSGHISDREWNETLATYQKGEPIRTGIRHTTFFRADGTLDTEDKTSPKAISPSN
jgi:hypothetical protein